MNKLVIGSLFALLVVASCSGTSGGLSQPRDYVTFWALNTKIDVNITISQANLTAIQTYGQEKHGQYNDYYFPATIRFQINDATYVFEEAGIRQKGNIFSRGPFLNDNAILENPFHFRLSFDQTYDEEFYRPLNLLKSWQPEDPAYQARKDRRLFGMKSLEFKWNRSDDPSLVNQVYASSLFKTHGVIAPYSTLATLSLQTENQGHDVGIYTINEAIDDIFIARHFQPANANGDLYKALYPNELILSQMASLNSLTNDYAFLSAMVGVENTEEFYHPTYDLKTNRRTSQHEQLMTLVKTLSTLNRLPTPAERLNTLNRIVDVDHFLMYAAVSYLTGNPDDMRNNKNNTYIYFDSITNKAYFIPYDLDWSLGLTWESDLTESLYKKSPFSTRNSFNQTIQNPLYWYTILTDQQTVAIRYPMVGNYRQTYGDLVMTIHQEESFSISAYQNIFTTKSKLYRNYSSTLPSNSQFVHMNLFATHYTELLVTIANSL
jgi:spore coat protein CotH